MEAQAPLDSNIHVDQNHQLLKLNHNRIINRYAQFVSHLCDCINEMKVSADNFRTFILCLPAFEADPGRDGLKDKLLEADTINEMINLVGNECASYMHYGILQSILEKYCTGIDHKELKYSEHFKDYASTLKVSQFIEIKPELKTFKCTPNALSVKVNSVLSSQFVVITNLQSAIASILGVWPSKLKILSIEVGIIVTFLIPTGIPVVEKLKAGSDELRSLSVSWLKYEHYKLDFTKKSFKHEKQMPSIKKEESSKRRGHWMSYQFSHHQPIGSRQTPRRNFAASQHSPIDSATDDYDPYSYPANENKPLPKLATATRPWYSSSEQNSPQTYRAKTTGDTEVQRNSASIVSISENRKYHTLDMYKPAKSYQQHGNPQVRIGRTSSLRTSRHPATSSGSRASSLRTSRHPGTSSVGRASSLRTSRYPVSRDTSLHLLKHPLTRHVKRASSLRLSRDSGPTIYSPVQNSMSQAAHLVSTTSDSTSSNYDYLPSVSGTISSQKKHKTVERASSLRLPPRRTPYRDRLDSKQQPQTSLRKTPVGHIADSSTQDNTDIPPHHGVSRASSPGNSSPEDRKYDDLLCKTTRYTCTDALV